MHFDKAQKVLEHLECFLLGKRLQLEYAFACVLARGHLLIEDVPGVGKTTLARSLAFAFHADFNRVQCTSDLLPSDLTGVTVFRRSEDQFVFQRGPLFTNILLADEINRANPKTQSALLEAMHENQISHDGTTYALPAPFFVIATQNRKDQHGTFPLPESQLDRFLMKLKLGYPSERFEKRVIRGDFNVADGSARILEKESLLEMQAEVASIRVADEILDFIYALAARSRQHPGVLVGVSPRGGQALYRAIQGLAYVRGRDFCIPDDVVELSSPVFGHRIVARAGQVAAPGGKDAGVAIVRDLLDEIPSPR